jgi:outer membrane protein, heavy metal efflux system
MQSFGRFLWRFAVLAVLGAGVAGCAGYHAMPLTAGSHLAPGLAALDLALPAGASERTPGKVDPTRPLAVDAVGLLAILNNPDLKAERGTLDQAEAELLQTSLLPNPSVGLGYAALLSGPGDAPTYTASLSEDVAAIVTYNARVASARAHRASVNADLLWQEWQVAQKGRLLALDIALGDRAIALGARARDVIAKELQAVTAATASGNLDYAALAPLQTAAAAADQALAAQTLERIKNWQALDALLGLQPEARFKIAPSMPPPLPADLAALVAGLPERRPDLVALKLGYRASEENVRAAILGQFPAFILGGTWNSDTSRVASAGPNVTFDLPIFNRNQGQIEQTKATRELLHAQYQSRLDAAVGDIRGLAAQAKQLEAQLAQARKAARSADALLLAARGAFEHGNLDRRALTDYETSALQRQLEVVDLERSLGEDAITLTVELGLGLPTTRIAPLDQARDS